MSLLSAHGVSRQYGRASLLGTTKPRLVLDAVSMDIAAGETVALLGRSGSGKSTLARILVGLEKPDAGEVRFHERPVKNLSKPERVLFRRSVQMVFQDCFGAVDPRSTIGEIVAEPLRHLLGIVRDECPQRVGDLLARVGLEPRDAGKLPQQMSGGQLQRVCIARALAPEPRLVILDEAVSNLDIHLQIQMLDLFETLRREIGVAYLFVTHDLRLAERFCSRVIIVDEGRVCEATASRQAGFATPAGRALRDAILPAMPPKRQPHSTVAEVSRFPAVPEQTVGEDP